MTGSSTLPVASSKHHDRGLVLIAAFKAAQALLFFILGLGALQLLHKDIGDVITAVAHYLRFNPESRLIDFILDKTAFIDDWFLIRIGAVVFVYSALDLLESIGLFFEKAWAEYLTLIVTGSFLPFELYELYLKLTVVRISLLAINLLVFFYLLKIVVERDKRKSDKENGIVVE